MYDVFIGRKKELADLNELYAQDKFQLFVLYGRRRVGKTTLLNEFCKDKDTIFYSAEQSNNKLNLEKFSSLVFYFYSESDLEPFHYQTSVKFLDGFSDIQRLELYGAFGGIPLYLQQVNAQESFEENIKRAYLKVTSYLYEEALLLLRQEVQEPGVYSAIIEAIAGGYTKANEISAKIGEDSAKCLKYIKTLCELGILHKETPFGEKGTSRKTIYGISDFMFRFWYRYVFANRTLIETGAQQAVWLKRIEPDYNSYMELVFEKVCMDYLCIKNAKGELPILFTKEGRWWGTNPETHGQEEIDLVANDGKDYIFGECKWRSEKLDLSVLCGLKAKADIFSRNRNDTYYVLFSKSGFTEAVINEAKSDSSIMLVGLDEIMNF